uniref:Uncharacterized protein n=1 Tax=Timema poppense TaxID=170557 RepID=A0A7R9CKI9_TIMPO|nr:unnamed protein product [Timema poppensis]
MSQLTEFTPLSPEDNPPGVGYLLSKIFKFGKVSNSPSRYYTLKIEKGHLDTDPGFESRVQV